MDNNENNNFHENTTPGNYSGFNDNPPKKRNLLPLFIVLILLGIICVNIYKLTVKMDLPWILANIDTLKKSSEITRLIKQNYYESPEDSELETGIYRGLIDSLNDPYSSYFTPEEWAEFNIQTTGKYGGIGARLSQDINTMEVTVVDVYDGSPAEEAGIRKGDTIVSADGVLAIDNELSIFVQYLRGDIDTDVSVIFKHNDEEKKVIITRKEVISPSVFFNMLDENTGYLQITQFEENTEVEFMNAIRALESEGMTDIIYDIRSNPGGLVKSVTDILDDMLPKGTTVYMEDKYGKRNTYVSDDEKQLNYPCIVLIDGASASSSEIFAGAIKDYEYGKLLGTKTYGKGIVQNTYRLSDGSAVKLTIAEYFTPKGNSIHKEGLTPDIELEYQFLGKEDEEYSQDNDNQIQEALSILNENSQPQ